MKTVEILYFDACPNWRETEMQVRRIVGDGVLEGQVSVRLDILAEDEVAATMDFIVSEGRRFDRMIAKAVETR